MPRVASQANAGKFSFRPRFFSVWSTKIALFTFFPKNRALNLEEQRDFIKPQNGNSCQIAQGQEYCALRHETICASFLDKRAAELAYPVPLFTFFCQYKIFKLLWIYPFPRQRIPLLKILNFGPSKFLAFFALINRSDSVAFLAHPPRRRGFSST